MYRLCCNECYVTSDPDIARYEENNGTRALCSKPFPSDKICPRATGPDDLAVNNIYTDVEQFYFNLFHFIQNWLVNSFVRLIDFLISVKKEILKGQSNIVNTY